MVRVLVAGHVNWDVTLQVDALPEPDGESRIVDEHQGGGGSAANTALVLARITRGVGLVGAVGDDDPGLHARRDLAAVGVDLQDLSVVDGETTRKYVLSDPTGQVAMLGAPGVNEAVTPDHVDDDRIGEAEHVHLTSQRPETAAHVARVASEAGTTVSVDLGRRIADRDYTKPLELADLVFRNEREARFDLPDARTPGRVVVTKLGGDGARAETPDGVVHHPGFPVEPHDTNGAGDAFDAGFLSVWLESVGPDVDYERALRVGNGCGALAVQQVGARSAIDSDVLSAFLSEHEG